jgi:D-alanyl-D-alanine carboxypeptidase
MKTFEIRVGQSQRLLKFEPQEKANTFKIYAADRAADWIDYEQSRSVDLPADGSLGIITVHNDHYFDFDGAGALTGQDLLAIAAQIVKHPQFKGD